MSDVKYCVANNCKPANHNIGADAGFCYSTPYDCSSNSESVTLTCTKGGTGEGASCTEFTVSEGKGPLLQSIEHLCPSFVWSNPTATGSQSSYTYKCAASYTGLSGSYFQPVEGQASVTFNDGHGVSIKSADCRLEAVNKGDAVQCKFKY